MTHEKIWMKIMLRNQCQKTINDNPKQAKNYRTGAIGSLGFFIGIIMQNTNGLEHPNEVKQILITQLEAYNKPKTE